jgi:phosphohistidine phosphatase
MAGERTLIVMRHGKSDWSGSPADRDRPLGKRGRRQAPESGAWLAEHVGTIDAAVVSPAERTRATWALVAAELGDPPEATYDERMYAGTEGVLLSVVRGLPEGATTAILVGHNPDVEDLVEALTGDWVSLPTSALAVLDVIGPWADVAAGTAVLRASGRPPESV